MKKKMVYLVALMAGSMLLAACGGSEKAGTVENPSSVEEMSNDGKLENTETSEKSSIEVEKNGVEDATQAEIKMPPSDPWASPYENTEVSISAYLGSCKDYDWRSLMRQWNQNMGLLTKKTIAVQRIDGNEIYGWTAVYDWHSGGYEEIPDEVWCIIDNREDKSLSVLNGDYITAYGVFGSDGYYAVIDARYIKFTNPSEVDPFFQGPELPDELEQCVIYIAKDSYKYRDGETTVEAYQNSMSASFGMEPIRYFNSMDKILASTSRPSGYIAVWQYGEFAGYVDDNYIYSWQEYEQKTADEENVGNVKENGRNGEDFETGRYNEDVEMYDEDWESEFIFPHSDTDIIPEEQIRQLDDESLRYGKNEIYAIHGRKFKDQELQEYFNWMSWYSPSVEPEDFDESVLSDIERENIQRIQAEIDRRENN